MPDVAAADPLAREAGAPPAAASPLSLASTLRAYLALTKPNIIWLLLITTVPAMVVADREWP